MYKFIFFLLKKKKNFYMYANIFKFRNIKIV